MKTNTRMLARAALLTALATALMYISAVIPSARAAVVAIAGLISLAAVLSCGICWAWGVFAVTACLSLLILPLKSCALLYTAFFGWYPIIKSTIERRIKKNALQWIAKLFLFNSAFAALMFLANSVLMDSGFPENIHGWMIAVAWFVLDVVFLIYDVLITRLVPIYIKRISGKLFRQGGQKQ